MYCIQKNILKRIWTLHLMLAISTQYEN